MICVVIVALPLFPELMSRFGGDSSIVGRAVPSAGSTVTVIGVMPTGFRDPGGYFFATPDVWGTFRRDFLGENRGSVSQAGKHATTAELQHTHGSYTTCGSDIAGYVVGSVFIQRPTRQLASLGF